MSQAVPSSHQYKILVCVVVGDFCTYSRHVLLTKIKSRVVMNIKLNTMVDWATVYFYVFIGSRHLGLGKLIVAKL